MATYVWKAGRLVNKRTGSAFAYDPNGEVAMPQVMRDTPEYRSPIDGRLITSRSQRREDLLRNNCVEVEPKKKGHRRFKNEAYIKKHNLPREF